jgi:CRISPR/Cas system Type II protein with McrA/HNH and RuvC-like nuclease domain
MKKILGLDLGTNSIGWALIEKDEEYNNGRIINIGSRIIPMGAEVSNFEQGNPQTKNAERRSARSIRRMGKRYKARRNKLLYVLSKTSMLPDQFKFSIPFDNPLKIQKVNLLPIKKGVSQLTALELLQLKVKALNEPIELKELGKLIFNYNQLRGYAGGGNDDEDVTEEATSENEEADFLKYEKIIAIVKVINDPIKQQAKKKGKEVFDIEIEYDGEVLKGETVLNNLKKNEDVELQIIIRRDKKGNVSSINFTLPIKTNWRKSMEELEEELNKLTEQKGSESYLCEYFLGKLLADKNYKLRNKVILRKRYQAEFDAIWESQLKFNPQFRSLVEDKEILSSIVGFIFPGNNTEKKQADYRNSAVEKGLKYLLRDQIIYYQRDLKDQSDLIGLCRFEKPETPIDKSHPNYLQLIKPFQVVAKSHPIFQEFKVWEQINKLSINTKTQKGFTKKGEPKYEYNDVPLPANCKQWLFDELQKKKEVSGKGFYTKLEKEGVIIKNESFLNGIHRDAKFKGNETYLFLKAQLKEWFDKLELNDTNALISFWDILYNAKGNEYDLDSERCKTIKNFIIDKCGLVTDIDKLTIRFAKIKFARNYSSLSLKAIEKMLPLMRAGKYFNEDLPININDNLLKILNENQEDPFLKALQGELEAYQDVLLKTGGMKPSYAAILVYGKHTAESYSGENIQTPTDIKPIPQGELRNPLAEQLINEAIKMVAEIWAANGEKPDEVRIELARELKNNADERNKIYKANDTNRKVNERVKQRLRELNKETSLGNIERYKLWSSQANEPFPLPEKANEPTKEEIEKMRLWEDQKCLSPYTMQPIPLSKLFDKGLYDIDHIIPKSRYFDDSMSNKVVCERSVNEDKGNRTSWEYFEVGSTAITNLLSKDQFTNYVNQNFFGKKRKNLLATKIPQDPVARQLKYTQYIATRVREEISKIVGSDNVKTTTGGVTDYLRNHWGVNEKFKEIVLDRYKNAQPFFAEIEFKKYEKEYDAKKKEYEKNHIAFDEPFIEKSIFISEFNKEYIKKEDNKLKIKGWTKRLDHRHHAMDALIVACTEQAHIQRLNNLNKELQNQLAKNKDLVKKGFEGTDEELLAEFVNLAAKEREIILEGMESNRSFSHPWKNFSVDAKEALETIIVSHKPKEKLLVQKVEKGEDAGKKDTLRIRGKLHDATLYGLSEGKESYRIKLAKLAGKQFATEKTIEKIIDPLIKESIKKHLEIYKGNKAEAFSAEGINELNKNRAVPIYGFKIYYKDQSEKYGLKKIGNKKSTQDSFNDILNRMIDEDLKNKLISHIDTKGGDFKEAFSETGIKELNQKLEEDFKQKNSTKSFKTINSIKLTPLKSDGEDEEIDLSLLPLERKSSYNNKLMVATGSNYAFVVLEKEGKRHYDEISFFDASNLVNKAFKNGFKNVQQIISRHFEQKHKGSKILFLLKQNEIVYLVQKDENIITDNKHPDFEAFWNDKKSRSKNVYKVVKFSGKEIYFLKHDIANTLVNKVEFGSQNCYRNVNNVSIKEHCIKLKVDRLGNIKPLL